MTPGDHNLGPEEQTDVLPRMVPSDPGAAARERDVREQVQRLTDERDRAMARQQAATLKPDDDPVGSLEGHFTLEQLAALVLTGKQLLESDCSGFGPPEDGGILPIDPAGDAETRRLRTAVGHLLADVEQLQKAVRALAGRVTALEERA